MLGLQKVVKISFLQAKIFLQVILNCMETLYSGKGCSRLLKVKVFYNIRIEIFKITHNIFMTIIGW